MNCLWIGRYIPYPLDAGAKLYSAKLAESLAAAGVFVRFTGFGSVKELPSEACSVDWVPVPNGSRRGIPALLLTALPLQAALDSTTAYVTLLEAQLRERWDAIVLDSYGAGWALKRCLAFCERNHDPRAVLVHVSHNHEELLWRSMAYDAKGSLLKRLALWQNYYKVRALERCVVRSVDLLTTITDEDRRSLGGNVEAKRTLTVTPGYSGLIARERRITSSTPRRVLLVGSFRWVVKQENLTRFVECADPVFTRHGIGLDVIGDIPSPLLMKLQSRCLATRFHGFIEDMSPFFERARIAVVPEIFGGGFKLKLLDYIFGRLPVAMVSQAAAGLVDEIRRDTFVSKDLPALVQSVIANIDNIDELNRMQESAFAHSKARFRWSDRGRQLKQAISEAHIGC